MLYGIFVLRGKNQNNTKNNTMKKKSQQASSSPLVSVDERVEADRRKVIRSDVDLLGYLPTCPCLLKLVAVLPRGYNIKRLTTGLMASLQAYSVDISKRVCHTYVDTE